MYIDITWKIALSVLVGLFVTATVVMNSSAVAHSSRESRSITRTAPDSSVCNIHDPFSPCFAGSLGYPAGDLFVEYF